jgi:hypothetical protein
LSGTALNCGKHRALVTMSDAAAYFLAHARTAMRNARQMERGAWRDRQRRVAQVYLLLAKQAARSGNVARINDFGRGRKRRSL